MARALNVPVLVAAQLNREVENRATKKPQLSDLRESGSLEQDADIVLFMDAIDVVEGCLRGKIETIKLHLFLNPSLVAPKTFLIFLVLLFGTVAQVFKEEHREDVVFVDSSINRCSRRVRG